MMLRVLALLCILLVSACTTVPATIYPPLDLSPRPIKQPRVALVLGGGGARGFAHLGVIKALAQAHIPIDLIVGTSAGSVVGSLYATNADIDYVTQILMKSTYPDFVDFSLRRASSGPMLGTQLQQFIVKNTGDCPLERTKIPFIAVATDLNRGCSVPIQRGSIGLAVTASCAVPTLVHPVQFANITLVDGGLADPVPVDIAKRYHPKVIIAVNIGSELRQGFPMTVTRILVQSINVMMMTLTNYNVRNADVVIRPEVGHASMFSLAHKDRLYEAGLVAGRKAVPKIRKLLNTRL